MLSHLIAFQIKRNDKSSISDNLRLILRMSVIKDSYISVNSENYGVRDLDNSSKHNSDL